MNIEQNGAQWQIARELSGWLVDQKEELVLSHELIAQELKKIRGNIIPWKSGKPVTQMELSHMIQVVRMVMEKVYKTTLYNVRGVGYKVANKEEVALYTAKFFKRTILYADRTYRLLEIVDRKKIPWAIRSVFMDNEGRIKNLSLKGKKFITMFVDHLKEEDKKEAIEHEKHEENAVPSVHGKRDAVAHQKV